MKTFFKIIAIILILALLAGFITFMVKSDFFRNLDGVELPEIPGIEAEPYIQINGQKFEPGFVLPEDPNLRIDVVNADEFSVNVVPGESFDFKVDRITYKFPVSLEADWNSVFGLQVGEGYFTFNNSNKDLGEILTTACFPEAEVTDFFNINRAVAYFEIEVTAGDTTLVLPITGFYDYMDITLSDEHIVF